MTSLFFFSVLTMGLLPFHNKVPYNKTAASYLCYAENKNEISGAGFQREEGSGRMSSVVFKNQEYCRAEVKDFEFETQFKVVSATVYFTGKNFEGKVERGFITGSSLKPIRPLMTRCAPGTVVTFDDVKVFGPDNKERIIPGITLVLY